MRVTPERPGRAEPESAFVNFRSLLMEQRSLRLGDFIDDYCPRERRVTNHVIVAIVDDTLDGGPIIAQRVVPVLDEDTEETLSARILEQEHQLYPEALRLVVEGNYKVIDRRVVKLSQGFVSPNASAR